MTRLAKLAMQVAAASVKSPRGSAHDLSNLPARVRGAEFARLWKKAGELPAANGGAAHNPLRDYFDSVKEGHGVWKWLHYFEVYHRHLAKFVGKPIAVVEVGVYSGGSMPMWRHYFGERCHVHGVDIEPDCKVYENDYTTIHIGDQADREFWRRFRESVPSVDVLIDDGGHKPEQQIVTLEEMLPHLNAGGVYICEDVPRARNPFSEFVHALADSLNACRMKDEGGAQLTPTTPFQRAVDSVHFYPLMAVIERTSADRPQLVAPKHGTQWQPFYEKG